MICRCISAWKDKDNGNITIGFKDSNGEVYYQHIYLTAKDGRKLEFNIGHWEELKRKTGITHLSELRDRYFKVIRTKSKSGFENYKIVDVVPNDEDVIF